MREREREIYRAVVAAGLIWDNLDLILILISIITFKKKGSKIRVN